MTSSEFLYQTAPQRLRFTFDQDVGASLSAAAVTLQGLQLASVSGPVWDAAMKTATFTVGGGGVLADGIYKATLSAAGVLNGSTPMAEDHVLDFFVLSGDANHDGWVDFGDLVVLAQNYGQSNRTYGQGDFNYDGSVGFEDLVILAQQYGSSATQDPGGMPGGSNREVVSANPRSGERVFNTVVPIRKVSAPKARRMAKFA